MTTGDGMPAAMTSLRNSKLDMTTQDREVPPTPRSRGAKRDREMYDGQARNRDRDSRHARSVVRPLHRRARSDGGSPSATRLTPLTERRTPKHACGASNAVA